MPSSARSRKLSAGQRLACAVLDVPVQPIRRPPRRCRRAGACRGTCRSPMPRRAHGLQHEAADRGQRRRATTTRPRSGSATRMSRRPRWPSRTSRSTRDRQQQREEQQRPEHHGAGAALAATPATTDPPPPRPLGQQRLGDHLEQRPLAGVGWKRPTMAPGSPSDLSAASSFAGPPPLSSWRPYSAAALRAAAIAPAELPPMLAHRSARRVDHRLGTRCRS